MDRTGHMLDQRYRLGRILGQGGMASVHIAEVFTTGLSGISHVKLGNVNKSLFLRLLLPGIILGGIFLGVFRAAP